MPKQRKEKLSPLDRKCLMKFYLHDIKLFRENSCDYVKSLGVEGTYETLIMIAEEEPALIKVATHDENNFVILLDERGEGRFTPMFIMKDGKEEVFEDDGGDD